MLQVILTQTTVMVEKFFPRHVIDRLPKKETSFWDHHNLEYRDWRGLASKVLKNVFSASFLQPLEFTDNCFELKVMPTHSLSRFIINYIDFY